MDLIMIYAPYLFKVKTLTQHAPRTLIHHLILSLSKFSCQWHSLNVKLKVSNCARLGSWWRMMVLHRATSPL